MNFKTTIALVIILLLVTGIGYVYSLNRANRPPERVGPPQEQFYLVDLEDIQGVEITYRGSTQKFVRGGPPDYQWRFDSPGKEPVNMDRWGGIQLLISGPRFERVIADSAADLARYGLEDPPLVVKADLEGLGRITIRVGDRTPDGLNHYALYQEERAIHLVAADWGDVLARLVTDPPYMPTPELAATPEPAGTSTPSASPVV
jgi:hypothetical protein